MLDNRVKIYKNPAAIKQIANLIANYPTIWESQNFVQNPSERWMTVLLKLGWELKIRAIKLRIYLLDNNIRCIINNIFDKIHK